MLFRNELLNELPALTLNPATEGVYRRYPVTPFNESNLGNPYPYGFDPVSGVYFVKVKCQTFSTALVLVQLSPDGFKQAANLNGM